jgi:histidinol dehydrogenase
MPTIRRLDSRAPDFASALAALVAWEAVADPRIMDTVRHIVAEVRRRGDPALVEFTNRFDRRAVASAAELVVTGAEIAQAAAAVPAPILAALQRAASRIANYHERQRQASWSYRDEDGTLLGQEIRPLDRAGIYVPGGKAAYPSSVLMNAIPAKVAGVGEIVMVVPAPDGRLEPIVLAAAAVAGVDRVITVGGAQAVAALAYGTETVPKVDKIVGPGNIYVAAAKSLVYGSVGIDLIAGPSEIAIVCDGGTDPAWIAMDLFSQAEHDEEAQSLLISPDPAFLDAVEAEIARLLPTMERREIIARSLAARGCFIQVASLDEACAVVNQIAPEHLELSVADPEALVPRIRHAGAIFLGRYTAEALGDYCAGPNHVLPTSGTARFSSPLGVYDFQKRSSLIGCTVASAALLGETAALLARGESLTAHARSAEYRMGRGQI